MIPLPLIKWGAIGLLVAAFGGWCWTGGKASERKVWKLKESAQIAAQLAASEQARVKELELQQRVNNANTALQTERIKHNRVAAGLKRDADQLRESIAGFASGKPDDTAAACRADAATLGTLLDSALRASGECASEAESVSADLRSMIDAWPSKEPK